MWRVAWVGAGTSERSRWIYTHDRIGPLLESSLSRFEEQVHPPAWQMSATEHGPAGDEVEWIFEFWGGVFSPRPKTNSTLR